MNESRIININHHKRVISWNIKYIYISTIDDPETWYLITKIVIWFSQIP